MGLCQFSRHMSNIGPYSIIPSVLFLFFFLRTFLLKALSSHFVSDLIEMTRSECMLIAHKISGAAKPDLNQSTNVSI